MNSSPVTSPDTGPRTVSRQVVVSAPPAEIFALVADPRRHGEIDGSGTVGASVDVPQEITVGSTFSVRMKQYGVPYKITSTITIVERDEVIEWQHPIGGHRWRYELAPAAGGATVVTETFDYNDAKAPRVLEFLRIPAKNAVGITATLEALAARFS